MYIIVPEFTVGFQCMYICYPSIHFKNKTRAVRSVGQMFVGRLWKLDQTRFTGFYNGCV